MKWNHKHQDVLLWFLEHPGGKQKECAKAVGYSEAWMSKIVNTQEFRQRHNTILNKALIEAARNLLGTTKSVD